MIAADLFLSGCGAPRHGLAAKGVSCAGSFLPDVESFLVIARTFIWN
jgi:hypothetical protein